MNLEVHSQARHTEHHCTFKAACGTNCEVTETKPPPGEANAAEAAFVELVEALKWNVPHLPR